MNLFLRSLPLCLTAAFFPVASSATAASFDFKNGDQVVIIGNGLADRMQHSGWLETLIQSRNAGKQLTFRNLGFTGDQVNSRPRNKGFTKPEDFLKQLGADVIFVF